MKPNKIIFGKEVLIDLTEDTVSHHKILEGEIAHDASGETIIGTIPRINDIQGDYIYEIETKDDIYEIEEGYHKGNESIKVSLSEQEKILPENIKTGVTILGIEGDFTADGDVTSDYILDGRIGYAKGERITGTCRFDADTSDGDATCEDILSGKIAYAKGERITGTMPVYPGDGEINGYISSMDDVVPIELGYHDGTETVSIDEDEKLKILPENIKTGVSILGVEGGFTSDATATSDNILQDATAYVNGSLIEGSIPIIERGPVEETIETKNEVKNLPHGYYGGDIILKLHQESVALLTPENIRDGVTILGVSGAMSPESDTSDATATPNDILAGKTAYADGVKITGNLRVLMTEEEENETGTTFIIKFREEENDELLDSGDDNPNDER